MPSPLIDQVRDALLAFTAHSRLYELTVGDERKGTLLVEAFAADEQLQRTGSRDIICLSTSAFIAPASLLGQQARLQISLASRNRTSFHGLITEASMLGSNGGLTRYRIRVRPWLWQLSQVRNSRAWEEKSVIEIIDAVFDAYLPQAQWRWSDDAGPFMDAALARSYCCQYRETDLDFVTRLLTEEGLAWRVEDVEDGHRLVIFADSRQSSAVPEDPSSAAGGGIRYHAAHAGEQSDTIESLTTDRRIMPGTSTLLSYDYKAKKIVKASVPTKMVAGKNMPHLEYFDAPGQYAFANSSQAERYAVLQAEALESRAATWQFRSTVRTLRPGTRLTMLGCPFTRDGPKPTYIVWRVRSIGVNNLPTQASEGLAELFGALPELLGEALLTADPEYLDRAMAQATASGYANWFDAILGDRPWRPMHLDDKGVERTHHQPTACGSQSAIVVGRNGETIASGADELYCDALGRIRVRFHWQDPDSNAGCWVRVAQRSAGGGMGMQFLPRIGMEVHVQFIENDIDRPIVVGALYNGRGESEDAAFARAHDHAASGQGNLASGNSPVWHGAAPATAGHSNKAALWGVRSKEFGGRGYNQLLFDDTDEQGRVQLRSTHAATELNLGHLIHNTDNYRGSFRGTGAELRTDDYGSVRAGAGLLITSYKIRHAGSAREPAGDNAAGIAMLKQAAKLAETFSAAAVTHLTVGLASHMGSDKANSSVLDDKASPLKALLLAASGMLSGESVKAALADASAKATAPANGKLPHSTDAIIAIAAKAGLGVSAGHDVQLASGDTATVISGQDSQFVAAGSMRLHTGQALGVLGGAVAAGENGLGVQLIAAQDNVDVQSQADLINVLAQGLVNVMSANGHIDWAAAKSISMSTAGGANITISGGNITVQCPGKIMVHAGNKSFVGPLRKDYRLPVFPVVDVTKSTGRSLKSSFAFDQLTDIAKTFSPVEFVALLVPIFGYDIPASTYLKLYDGLRSGTVKQPVIELQHGGHYPASFDNDTRKILVHQAAADRAANVPDESWELLTALLHEFGHYVDVVLRSDLADKNEDGSSTLSSDSADDEGAKFAYQLALFDFGGTSQTTYAEYCSPTYSGPLKVNYNAARKAIRRAQDEQAQHKEGKSGNVEHFGAGMGEHYTVRPKESFGHQSIESSLIHAANEFGKPNVLRQIYFGNWLRDFSQIVDPAIVRKPTETKDFPRKISRAQLTKLVDVLAEAEFALDPSEKQLFRVTESMLGVYRPVEHIDNPTNENLNAIDPQSIDADFQPKATKLQTSVDPASSMKRYIQESKAYMASEITRAVAAGPTTQGYRHFGAALHVLEDYFAHSNFIELALRKLGYDKVLPWTSPAAGKHALPVVTGMFDSDDVIASTAGLIADVLFKVEWEFKASKKERTKADRVILIMLEECRNPAMLKNYNQLLLARDWWAELEGHQYVEGAMHYSVGMVGNVYGFVYSTLLHLVGNSVDDQQTLRKGDPNTNGSTDPTHSQLAKDHDNHPFHTIAAQLASIAITKVGVAIAGHWWPGQQNFDPARVASAFLVHPFDSTWQDAPVRNWAVKHPNEIRRGQSSTEWEALEKAHKKEIIDSIKKAGEARNRSWKYINENYQSLFKKTNQVRK